MAIEPVPPPAYTPAATPPPTPPPPTDATALGQPNPQPLTDGPEQPSQHVWMRRLIVTALVLVGLTTLLASGMTVADPDYQGSNGMLRIICIALAGAYLLCTIALGVWGRALRSDVATFKGRGSSSWTSLIPWIAVPIVAAPISFKMADAGVGDGFFAMLYAAMGLVRIVTVRSLGTELERLVKGAKSFGLIVWGLLALVADVGVIGVATYGFVDIENQRQELGDYLAQTGVALLIIAPIAAAYMRRTSRGVVTWWDNRHGMTEDRVAALAQKRIDRNAEPVAYARRRLAPTAPFRLVVMVSYWIVAGAAMFNAVTIYSLRDELTFSSDPEATLERILTATLIFLGALAFMQLVQGMWAVGQAWNAQRATLAAPSPLVMVFLFILGPSIAVIGASLGPDFFLIFVSLAALVNLICWFLSFGLLRQTMEALGKSTESVKRWSFVVSLHWALIVPTRFIDRLDEISDVTYATAIAAVGVVDALIFIAASFVAWTAMRDLDEASREFEQIRRVNL